MTRGKQAACLIAVAFVGGSILYRCTPLKNALAQSGQQQVSLGTTPLNTAYKAGSTTLTGNVTAWTIANGFDAAQAYSLTICQPSGQAYTVSGAPSNFDGALLVPASGACATTSLFWIPNTAKWYSFRIPYALIPDAPAIPTNTTQLTNGAGFVTATQAASAAPVQSVNGQTGAVTISSPTKLSQLTNDAGFIAFAPFNVTFPSSSLLAIGNYPVSVSVPSAAMGQGVECNLINFSSASYRVTGVVSAAGTVTANLNVQAVLATNTTAPIGRCFSY